VQRLCTGGAATGSTAVAAADAGAAVADSKSSSRACGRSHAGPFSNRVSCGGSRGKLYGSAMHVQAAARRCSSSSSMNRVDQLKCNLHSMQHLAYLRHA
jgi:hypothetical protein